MSGTRREFLKSAVGGAVGAAAWMSAPGLAAPFVHMRRQGESAGPGGAHPPTLIIVYLRGGADPLNAIVPFHDPEYYALRPTIAVPRPVAPDQRKEGAGARAAIPITRSFGFHPAMAPLVPLYRERLLAPIVNVGSHHETRSHFDAQDFMERAAPGVRSVHEGWLNRFLKATSGPDDHFLRAFSPQPLLPRSLRGTYSVLAAPGEGSTAAIDAFRGLYRRQPQGTAAGAPAPSPPPSKPLPDPTREKKKRRHGRRRGRGEAGGTNRPARPPFTAGELSPMIHDAGVSTAEKLSQLNRILRAAGNRQQRDARYPRGPLGPQFADVAAVLKAEQPLQITALDYNGWDHHSYEGGAQGRMAAMLEHLSQCLVTFVEDVGRERMRDITILTMSEFGRTARENGSQGSDHGHGGFMLAIGGRIAGGKIYGKWTGLRPNALHEKRDMPVHTDFRAVFAETLRDLYLFDTSGGTFFPDYETPLRKPLGLFRQV